jgi:hypothetical protein
MWMMRKEKENHICVLAMLAQKELLRTKEEVNLAIIKKIGP